MPPLPAPSPLDSSPNTAAQGGGVSYAPGGVAVIRDEEWLITGVDQTNDGPLLRVQGLSELVRGETAQFFPSLDTVELLDPREARVVGDGSPRYRLAKLWVEATLRKTPIPLSEPRLDVPGRMLLNPLPYQQEAVRRPLNPDNLRPRLLLADAVGLGKTLEIGMILSELVRRGRGERILLVTPRHVLEQMQHEMWCRFALPFMRLDSAGLQRVRQKLPASRNPFSMYKRAIISIDTLKSDRYLAYLRKTQWDAVVIDESHNVTNSETQNNRLARTLAPNTDALILASATPHNGKTESFAELIRLLDPTAVGADGELDTERVKQLVLRRHRNSPSVKSHVGNDWAPRKDPRNILVPASPAESAVAQELADTWLYPASGASPYSGQNSSLFPWTLAKAFLSSPAALTETVTTRAKKVAKSGTPGAERELQALECLRELSEAVTPKKSAKYQRLVEYLQSIEVGSGKPTRCVIFSERVDTLHWLRENLRKDLKFIPDAVRVMHGGLSDVEQQELVESFKQKTSPIRLLITGDVASEGVNLHRECHHLVHYDIPWSLIRIEQRNGRIDRYGQRHQPEITTLLLDVDSEQFSGDLRVFTRLIEKEHEAHLILGDAAPLMGEYSAAGEERLIKERLSQGRGAEIASDSASQRATADPLMALLMGDITAEEILNPTTTAGAPGTTEAPDEAAPSATTEASDDASERLYPSDAAFLKEALVQVFETPEKPLAAGGVDFRPGNHIEPLELEPTRDLKSRLNVLPTGYVRDRGVLTRMMLATTEPAGNQSLSRAMQGKDGSTWPVVHYLSPLHPVLDWVSDRVLGSLGRGEVFAVRGAVEVPTVLTISTLTNHRGFVVAAGYVSVAFHPGLPLPQQHASALEMLRWVGFTDTGPNQGAPQITPEIQNMVREAVDAAHKTTTSLQSAHSAAQERVAAWAERANTWQNDADALVQRHQVEQARVSVAQQAELAQDMAPRDTLTRPLLVVLPADHPVAEEK